MKFFTIVFTLLLILPSFSWASKSKNAWTQCGIGAAIFPSYGSLAAISNIIWDWGLTATTSSSSSPSQCAGKDSSVGKLIYENYAQVEEETAIGQGEHLTAMMSILECDPSIQSQMIQDVRSQMLNEVKESSFTKKSTLEKTDSLFNNVMDKAGNKYARHCSIG